MSRTHIPAELRRLVRARAQQRCEYCRMREEYTGMYCPVDHIVSEKHGGQTVADNLACSCYNCNINKGSDLGSLAARTGELVRFFNPRIDEWDDHFRVAEDGATIEALTDTGDVTVRIFGFDEPRRVQVRAVLAASGHWP